MNNENFEFKAGDRVMIEGVLIKNESNFKPLRLEIDGTDLSLTIKCNGKIFNLDEKPIIKLIERPKLTFEFIRNNLVPMKHLLISETGEQRLYLGFNRNNKLITDKKDGNFCLCFCETEISNWTYKEFSEITN